MEDHQRRLERERHDIVCLLMKCGPSVPIGAHRQLDAELKLILSAAKLNSSRTSAVSPGAPVPKRSAGAFLCVKPRQVTTLRLISRGALGRLPLGYNVGVQ